MERLTSRDLRRVIEFLGRVYIARDLDGFVAHMLAELPQLVASELTVYGELNPPKRRFRFIGAPVNIFTDAHIDTFRRVSHEHPFAQRYRGGGDGSAMKISDVITRRQFCSRGVYHESYRPYGIDCQMVTWLPTREPLELTFAVHRSRTDFSERDRLMLDVLRPHLVQAYRNAEAYGLFREAAGLPGQVPILLDHDRRPGIVSVSAREILDRYFDRVPRSASLLPDKLERWVRNELSLRDGSDVSRPREPFVAIRNDHRLVIRLLSGPAQHLLLLKEERTSVDPGALEPLGLTRRQAQVLAWVAEGKTNEEIGRILGVRPRTVAKHLEMMYPRLGVENRTAAAAQALETARADARS